MPNYNKLSAELHDEIKYSVRLYLCGRCGGAGAKRSTCEHEERLGIEDDCYRCMGKGLVNEEQHFEDVKAAVVGRIALERVEALFKAALEDEDGYDFALAAAENMMSMYEYKMERVWAEGTKVEQELEGADAVRWAALAEQYGVQ